MAQRYRLNEALCEMGPSKQREIRTIAVRTTDNNATIFKTILAMYSTDSSISICSTSSQSSSCSMYNYHLKRTHRHPRSYLHQIPHHPHTSSSSSRRNP